MKFIESIDLNLADELEDKEFRDAFFEHWSIDEVSSQIRNLRKARKLRQVDVAHKTGTKQSGISRIESSDYSKWNFSTLLNISQALDARVRVILEPAEEVIRQYRGEEDPANESDLKSRLPSIRDAQAKSIDARNQIDVNEARKLALNRDHGQDKARYHQGAAVFRTPAKIGTL